MRAFGQYRLIRKLATGGMAEIFLAKQLGPHGFERDVVIKRLRPELNEREDFLKMFLDEARLAARLSHPNVVQIHDVGMLDRHYFICMEYLAGEDFGALIRTAKACDVPVPPMLAARVIAEAAHGLHYAHELADENGRPLNIVHRDVSPSNLFVTYQGNVKVLDFGIARAESRLCETGGGILKGKSSYVSPEQVMRHPADRRSDVYMLGLTLYEALTGIQPFASDNPLASLKAVLSAGVAPVRELRPDVPESLEAIVQRAMARDPHERFQSADVLAAALELYLADFTNSTANAGLHAFARALMGDERVASRSNLPSLATLQAQGVRIAGFSEDEAPARPDPVSKRRLRGWHAGVIAAAVVALGGTVAARIVHAPAAPVPAPEPVARPEPHLVRVECEAEGGPPLPATVPVASAPTPSGKLTLDTIPWTRVYLGDTLLGETPIVEAVLPAGHHALRLENDARGIRRTVTIEVKAQGSTIRRLDL